ncbi:unnamed protein product [Phytophthora lilii]|uniref:Unnamed protein product n=1 Tax=Phytophthora lilii TaxID=2077276 RepID=A0A9W6TI04_9STRA|nr:unnamed protein product [Phytophthora lilii]
MEEEIAELRLELKQELAREKQKQEDEDEVLDEEDARFQDLNDKYTGPSGNYVWEKEMESSRKQHVAWGHKIERVVQMLKERQSGVAECKKRETRCGNQVDESVDSLMQELGPFLRQQKRFVEKLGRENVKLRDMLHARPTRRELLVRCRD